VSGQESGRQRKRRERMADREAAGLAYQVHHHERPDLYRGERLDQHAPGEHVWIINATFRVTEQAVLDSQNPAAPALLDRENLALVTGPGCWVCEEPYTTTLAALPCPGEPS
jgi:hypothetical protein